MIFIKPSKTMIIKDKKGSLYPFGSYERLLLAILDFDIEKDSVIVVFNPKTNALSSVLTDQEIEGIKNILKTLAPREQKVLEIRFGLEDGVEHTLREVGNFFGVSGNRIRQIQNKALRKLRHPSRLGEVSQIFFPVSNLIRLKLEHKEQADQIKALTIENNKLVERLQSLKKETAFAIDTRGYYHIIRIDNRVLVDLLRPVDEIEWSVRALNCLRNEEIRLIGELVQRTENQMLRVKNFGRKSLNEIKEVLAKLGLTFGMQFSEEVKNIIDMESYKDKDNDFY